ncbi:MAG: Holliday junction DNA helicase RuvB C-terminal domain-containing protein, partial [Nanoarchaeota archaeon]
QIFLSHVDGHRINNDIIKQVVSVARGTARNCVLLADDINNFCQVYRLTNFGEDEWLDFKKTMSVNVLGLNSDEISYLKLASKHAQITLTGIASAMEQDRKSVQRAIEPFLLKLGLITVQTGGRKITTKGLEILKKME